MSFRVYGYHSFDRSNLKFFGKPDNKRFFGVELELDGDRDGDRSSVDLPIWMYAMEDSSVSGVEFITHPMSLDKHLDGRWERILTKLRVDGYSRGRNGMHVHISRNAFVDKRHLHRFCMFFHLFPKWTLRMSARDESSLASWASTGTVRSDYSETHGRCATNLQNEKTVEIRIFRSTTNHKTLTNRIKYLDCLMNFTQQPFHQEEPAKILDDFLNGLPKDLRKYFPRKHPEKENVVTTGITTWRDKMLQKFLRDLCVYIRPDGTYVFTEKPIEDTHYGSVGKDNYYGRPIEMWDLQGKSVVENFKKKTRQAYLFKRVPKNIFGNLLNPGFMKHYNARYSIVDRLVYACKQRLVSKAVDLPMSAHNKAFEKRMNSFLNNTTIKYTRIFFGHCKDFVESQKQLGERLNINWSASGSGDSASFIAHQKDEGRTWYMKVIGISRSINFVVKNGRWEVKELNTR